jgi:hypothetical protein
MLGLVAPLAAPSMSCHEVRLIYVRVRVKQTASDPEREAGLRLCGASSVGARVRLSRSVRVR